MSGVRQAIRILSTAAGAAVLLAGGGAAAGATSILYDDNVDGSITTIVRGDQSTPGLTPARGALRQEPSVDHLLGGDADAPARIAKVSAGQLTGKSAAEIAALLRREIDGSCPPAGCASGLVAVDEITGRFADGTTDAKRLQESLVLLDSRPYPGGGSYADRTHFYIGPGVVTAVGYGLGPNHNLGRDGVTKRSGYTTVLNGLARAGGLWLEMYRPGNARGGETYSLERQAWESGPRDIAQLIVRYGGSLDRVHLLMSNPGIPPVLAALPGGGTATASDYCATMACVWGRATDPSTINPRLAQNGVGQYQLGSRGLALEWLRGYNAAEASPPAPRTQAEWLAAFQEPGPSAGSPLAPFRRIGKPRKPSPGTVAVKLQARGPIRVVFRIGVRYRKVRRVVRGTRRVEFPIPRCGACTVMKVRIVVGGTTHDTFRIAALAADRRRAR